MRAVLDTNIYISALISPASCSDHIITLWRKRRFIVLTDDLQLEELRRVTRYPKIRSRLKPVLAGRLLNDLRKMTENVKNLPPVDASPDPYDNYLLAIAEGGEADFLVTGDKQDLLSLARHGKTKIVAARNFIKHVG